MFPDILFQNEGKTLEFKENAQSINPIIKTIVAFANTAGGTIIIGVEDETKKVVGVSNILLEEERLANIIVDSIEPMLHPDIEIVNYNKFELLVINVPYLTGPYFIKMKGINKGAYVRLGSTNRLADNETLSRLLRMAEHISFDETPCLKATLNDLDHALISKKLKPLYKSLQERHYLSLGLTTIYRKKIRPTYGALLLFSPKKSNFLPDSNIRCACFAGDTRGKILDYKDINSNLIEAVDNTIAFIDRHTSVAVKIGKITREDIPQFPPIAVREAVINALVHADYSMTGASIQIAIFADRIEITNPGALPFGQSMESALSGISRARNRLIIKIFRELKLIERLGSGIPRIFESYKERIAQLPKFEELGNHFRVTLYEVTEPLEPEKNWELELIKTLEKCKRLSTKDIAELWQVTARTARTRLNRMLEKGLIERIAKSKTDPTSSYQLKQ